MGVGGAGGEVQRAGTQGREADAGAAGEAAMGGGHEARRLLVAGQDQLDLGVAQGFDDVEILLAGNPEDSVDPLVLEGGDEEI